MSGQYKIKECPNCGLEHRKKGQYCSQSCANESRTLTAETKAKISQSINEYNQTPEGLASARKNAERMALMNKGLESNQVTIEDFAVDIPDIRGLEDYDGLEGYDRADRW